MHLIPAVLSVDLVYTKENTKVVIPKGTKVLIDAYLNEACVNGDYVEIEPEEWNEILP